MQSNQSHQFSQVPSATIPRSSFNRNCGFKATFDAGLLIPIFVDEVLPADTFNITENLFGRLSTPLFPFMDNLFLDTFYFYVPNRILWDNWKKFNGEQKNPGDSTSYLVPQLPAPVGGFVNSTLADYFGIPTAITGFSVNSLHFRAYNLIYNEWFRDQNLQNSVSVPLGDGPDVITDFVLKKRGKRHDYFTSALPFPQKGPAVSLPLGTSAPVVRTSNAANPWLTKIQGSNTTETTTGPLYSSATKVYNNGTANNINFDPNGTLQTDLSAATAATINQLREAFQVQKLYERDARGGTRYTEIIRSHFGVVSPDARLQRPEYLGGGSQRININPVAVTAATKTGDLAATGTVSASGRNITKSFTEHGVIIGLCSVRADLSYQEGLNRMWSRQTRFDFYWPALSHLGEQAVLNKEIYVQGTSADTQVFGYQERYAEYRYKPSVITSKFRSNAATSLDVWHLAQDFASLPLLNSTFIEENPPIARVVAVPSEPQFKLDAYFEVNCARPMPLYSVPSMIDHF